VVLEAAKALEAANATGDAQKIRAAMAALDAALRGQAQAAAEVASQDKAAKEHQQAMAAAAPADATVDAAQRDGNPTVPPKLRGTLLPKPHRPPRPSRRPKPVVAMRGDDRPGMKKAEPAQPAPWRQVWRPQGRARRRPWRHGQQVRAAP
jgi:ATP-dependent RNA helicase SUPV3L1/SUV3